MLRRRAGERASKPEPLAAKVPEITAMFWVIKLITTGIGESTSDFLGQTNVAMAGFVGLFGMWYALRRQLRARDYQTWTYWMAVLMVAVFGTMVADGIKDGAGIPYSVTTPFFALVVAAIFFAWHRSEGTLSIHSITSRRRERFYWAAVLGTFALGTAAGDLTAYQLHLGFFPSAILFGLVFAIPGIGWKLGLNPIVSFWAAYVVTRPLGASFADGFSKPGSGLNLGDGPISAVGLIAFAVLVAYLARTRNDVQDPEDAAEFVPVAHRQRELQVAEG